MDKENLVKTNLPGYVKNPVTNVVTNQNIDEYEQYKALRAKSKELNSIKSTIDDLNRDIQELKQLLHMALKGSN